LLFISVRSFLRVSNSDFLSVDFPAHEARKTTAAIDNIRFILFGDSLISKQFCR